MLCFACSSFVSLKFIPGWGHVHVQLSLVHILRVSWKASRVSGDRSHHTWPVRLIRVTKTGSSCQHLSLFQIFAFLLIYHLLLPACLTPRPPATGTSWISLTPTTPRSITSTSVGPSTQFWAATATRPSVRLNMSRWGKGNTTLLIIDLCVIILGLLVVDETVLACSRLLYLLLRALWRRWCQSATWESPKVDPSSRTETGCCWSSQTAPTASRTARSSRTPPSSTWPAPEELRWGGCALHGWEAWVTSDIDFFTDIPRLSNS